MSGGSDSIAKTAATFGIVGGGGVSFLSGIVLLATLSGHTPRILMGVFVLAVATTFISVVIYLADDVRQRARAGSADGDGGGH